MIVVRDISDDGLAAALGSAYTITERNVLNYVCKGCVNFLCNRGVYPPPPVLRRQSAAAAPLHDDEDDDEDGTGSNRCTFAAHAAAALTRTTTDK